AAGIEKDNNEVELLIACTDRDEVNLMACWIAKRMGVPHVISRAIGLEFTDNSEWAKDLGIDTLLSPERSVARKIEEILQIRAALEAYEIANGRAGIYVFRVAGNSELKGRTLLEIRQKHPHLVMLIVCVKRGEETFVPKASDSLQEGDRCYTMCYRNMTHEIEELFQPTPSAKLRNIIIIGGGKVGFMTASRLINHTKKVKISIIDKDHAKCEKLSAELPKALVLHGDGSDADTLRKLNITDAGFVATTESNETNLILAVLAKTLGAKKSIAVVDKNDYVKMTDHIPVDAILNRNQALADEITRRVYFPGKKHVMTVLNEINAETVETTVEEKSFAAGKSLVELKMPRGTLVVLLERENRFEIPTGGTVLQAGDQIVLFGPEDVMSKAAELFEGNPF
ncbi:MAG: Trk system potassium transporter TrkA, partial [Synergistes sp.]|nr:Trk system potassium transporter TrkA [Synergistes sp.]